MIDVRILKMLEKKLSYGSLSNMDEIIHKNARKEVIFSEQDSNSFSKDQYHLGLEYDFKNILLLRGGYVYEDGINPLEDDYDTRTTVFTGPTAGASVRVPLNKENGSVFSIDYSYRDTNPFMGVHTIGARIIL